MTKKELTMLDWTQIDTVLLDMDGTLLDLHFDTYFWLEHLPHRYAQIHGLQENAARSHLTQRITEEKGTLNWYCVDYWSRELGVDIAALKREISHKVAFRPQVQNFLQTLKAQQIRTVIVTNAHPKSLAIKMEKTALDQAVDALICSHDFNLPKEDTRFWSELHLVEPFNKERTLLIDDSEPVLQSAQRYGIRHLLTIYQPDSQTARSDATEFKGIDHFDEINPTQSKEDT
jgi:putative hydrolase of the HAD superfamily